MGFLFGERSAAMPNSSQSIAKVINLLDNGYSLWEINRRLTEIPEVRSAVNMIGEICAIVPLDHVIVTPRPMGQKQVEYVNGGSFNEVLQIRANKWQSPQVFKTNIISRVLYNNNVFAIPEWGRSADLLSLTPLPFTQFEFQNVEGIDWVVFPDAGTAFMSSDLIHLQRFPDIKHGMKRQAIYAYTDVVGSMQAASIKKLEADGKVKALLIAKSGGLKDKDFKAQLEEFKETYLTSENVTGLGMIRGNYEVQQIDLNSQSIDTATMDGLTDRIYSYLGTSGRIMNGTASELEYQQFGIRCKAILNQLCEELTFKLFSMKEIRAGHRIDYDDMMLEIVTMAAKTNFLDKAVYQGTMTRNEGRKRIGMSWIEGGDELLTNKNAQSMKEVTNDGQ